MSHVRVQWTRANDRASAGLGRSRSRGAAQTELVLIIAGVALLALGALCRFGDRAVRQLARLTDRLSGTSESPIPNRTAQVESPRGSAPMDRPSIGGSGAGPSAPGNAREASGPDPGSVAGLGIGEGETPGGTLESAVRRGTGRDAGGAPEGTPSAYIKYILEDPKRPDPNDAKGFTIEAPIPDVISPDGLPVLVRDRDDMSLLFAGESLLAERDRIVAFDGQEAREGSILALRKWADGHRQYADALDLLARRFEARGSPNEAYAARRLAEDFGRLAARADGISDQMDDSLFESQGVNQAHQAEINAVHAVEERIAKLRREGSSYSDEDRERMIEEIRSREGEMADLRDALLRRGTPNALSVAQMIAGHLKQTRIDLSFATDAAYTFSGILEGSHRAATPGRSVSQTLYRDLPGGAIERITARRETLPGGGSKLVVERSVSSGAYGQADQDVIRAGSHLPAYDRTEIFFQPSGERVLSSRLTVAAFSARQRFVEETPDSSGDAMELKATTGQASYSVSYGDPMSFFPNSVEFSASVLVGDGELAVGLQGGEKFLTPDDTQVAGFRGKVAMMVKGYEVEAKAKAYVRRGADLLSGQIEVAGDAAALGFNASLEATRNLETGDSRLAVNLEASFGVGGGLELSLARERIRRGADAYRPIQPEFNDLYDSLQNGELRETEQKP